MTDTATEKDLFHTHVDLEVEKNGIIANITELIEANRELRPMIVYYRGPDRVLSISSRRYEDEPDRNKAIMQMLYMLPALRADTSILAYCAPVHLIDVGAQDCIITIAIAWNGALAEVFPFRVTEDEGLIWDNDAAIDPTQGAYDQAIQHMLPTFVRTNNSMFKPSELIDFLSARGFEVELFGDWDYKNIDLKILG